MTLIAIILATLASGIGSVWLAAFLLRRRRGGVDSVGPQHLLSLAAGALLATAFMHLLPGDSVHCFGDGVLIASAFVADMRLGLIAAASVLAHEVPHHMGDLVVMLNSSANRNMALVKVSLAGAVTALGGLAGYFLLEQLHDWLPYFLVVASSSFVYVALADLIPQLQRRLSARETAIQIALLLTGMGVVTLVSGLAHGGH